jgi:hypothetical protein
LDRQHTVPLLLISGSGKAKSLTPLAQQSAGDLVSAAKIQALIHRFPECLPIAEIDPVFSGPVPICTELKTLSSAIDNFMVTPSGLPVLVECKLWSSPEVRHEAVGQILDYAKELSRWSSSDLQREVSRRLKRNGNPLLDAVRRVDPKVDEIEFNDALTANLRRGRFLLLIVGDGIREGVETIAGYLQRYAGLYFSLGLVELPIYAMSNGDRLVAPRVLARTTIITRNVVALPDGYVFQPDAEDPTTGAKIDRKAFGDARQRLWKEFLDDLKLDDPEQPKPRPARASNISFPLPAPISWLNVYYSQGEMGIFPSCRRNTAGSYAVQAIVDEWNAGGTIKDELGSTVRPCKAAGDSLDSIVDSLMAGSLDQADERKRAFSWLAERVNTFVNVMRPRVRSTAADYQQRGE